MNTQTESFEKKWTPARRHNWPAHFEAEAITHIQAQAKCIEELIATLRAILDAPGEGYTTMSDPDSFETQCRNATELLNRLNS